MNVLKFRKFDEKRAITPKWVMGFKIKVKFKLQTCSACQDLHTLQF
jgi:hypothetical protein